MFKHFQLKTLLLLVVMLVGVGNVLGDTTYKLEQVTSVEANGLYVFEQGGYVMNNTISSNALQTTNSYSTTGLTGTETYVWKLEASGNYFKMMNVSLDAQDNSAYLDNSSSTTVSFNASGGSWSFNFQNDGTVLIQNPNNSNRFLGYTSSSSHAYKAYATNNLSSYPHAITVYKLVEETGVSIPTVATPTFSVEEGTYLASQDVEIFCETEGATIYYTTDGNDPTTLSSVYSSAIPVSTTTTIKAMATKSDYNNSAVASATYTIEQAVSGYTVDFESSLDAYTDWTFTNAEQGTGVIVAHGGDYYATTGGKATAAFQTKEAFANPGTFTCYISKTTTNTNSSTWYIQVSSDGSTWTDVKTQSATEMSKGEWNEFTADLSGYTNVYVRLYYSGSTAVRTVDDITLTEADPNVKKTPIVTIDYSGLTTDLAGSSNVNAGTLTATVTSGENTITEPAVTWSSSDDTVATVNATTGAVTLLAVGTTTITASFAGNDEYNEASDTYELTVVDTYAEGGENNPYSVAEARAAIDAEIGTQGVYASGIVSEIIEAYSSTYKNITFDFVDSEGDTNTLRAYRCKGDEAENVQVGDTVVVTGNLTKYNEIYEFAQGCTLVSLKPLVVPATEQTLTVSSLTNVEMFVFAGDESEALLEGTGSATVLSGTEVMLSVSAEEGYVLESLIVDGEEHVSDITTEGVYLFTMPSNDVTITATAVEYVAPVTDDYALFTGELVEGDYLIVYGGKAMNTTVTSKRLQYADVTANNDVISTADASIVWHIAKSGNFWTIYNADAAAYAASNGTKNQAQMLADGTDDKALWTVSGNETYEFVNKYNSANSVNANLRGNGTNGFACYSTSTGGALSLYKKVADTPAETVTISSVGWTTYVTKGNVTFGDDVTAYIVSNATATSASLVKVTTVEADTPVLVEGAEGSHELSEAETENYDDVTANKLLVSNGSVTGAAGNIYCLANGTSGVGFYRVANNVTVPDGKCYLVITDAASDPARSFVGFGFNEETAIESVAAETQLSHGVYDLQGRRMSEGQMQKGLYIVNGKKMIVK